MMPRRIIDTFCVVFLSVICIFLYIRYTQLSLTKNRFLINRHIVYPNIAVLVEFRSSPLLVPVVSNILRNIPDEWPIQIFHGKNNLEFIQNSPLNKYIKTERILLHQLDSMIGNSLDYTNKLLTNITFWHFVKGEKVLFFQLDSVFCSNSPHKIKDFLKYDYIGAPWHSRFKIPVKVGNGGFSLRSRSKLLELLSIRSYNHQLYHEDVWFSRFLHLVNASIAPMDIAMKFSVETIFYETPMAVHKPIYLNAKELKILCKNCPEMQMIPPFCI